jgi:hypothetical protein
MLDILAFARFSFGYHCQLLFQAQKSALPEARFGAASVLHLL